MILCLSGFKGSGKDALANYLISKHNAVRVALADPLKDSVAQEFNIPRHYLDDPKFKESPILSMPVDPKDGFSRTISEFMRGEFRCQYGKRYGEGSIDSIMYWTPRSLAILKGSTNRSVQSNYWTNKAFESIENTLKSKSFVVVTDLRYKSEMTQFKEKFGENVIFVRINRFKESPSQDPSERDLDDAVFDFYIDNTGTLDGAYWQVEEMLAHIGNKALDELAKETEALNIGNTETSDEELGFEIV